MSIQIKVVDFVDLNKIKKATVPYYALHQKPKVTVIENSNKF